MSKKASKKHSISNGKLRRQRLKPASAPLASTPTEVVGGGGGNAPLKEASKPALDQYLALLDAMMARQPTDQEISELSRFVVANPGIWFVADVGNFMANVLIRKTYKGAHQALLSARAEILEKQLGGDDSTPLERLMIEQVVLSWVRMHQAEGLYNSNVVGVSTTSQVVMHWDQLLANAQRRHLTAVEALARIRRLGRITPAVQFNIAQSGSQQMNVQGESQSSKRPQNEPR